MILFKINLDNVLIYKIFLLTKYFNNLVYSMPFILVYILISIINTLKLCKNFKYKQFKFKMYICLFQTSFNG